jgi:hypothetical protein
VTAGIGSVPEFGDNAEPEESDEPEDLEAVDVDLDSLDEDLRDERVGKPTTVRIDGKVIHIDHAGDWSSTAMRAASMGDWEAWAREVIADDREFRLWVEADLHNYQIEAVFDQCGKAARLNAGKSARSRGSRRASRRR